MASSSRSELLPLLGAREHISKSERIRQLIMDLTDRYPELSRYANELKSILNKLPLSEIKKYATKLEEVLSILPPGINSYGITQLILIFSLGWKKAPEIINYVLYIGLVLVGTGFLDGLAERVRNKTFDNALFNRLAKLLQSEEFENFRKKYHISIDVLVLFTYTFRYMGSIYDAISPNKAKDVSYGVFGELIILNAIITAILTSFRLANSGGVFSWIFNTFGYGALIQSNLEAFFPQLAQEYRNLAITHSASLTVGGITAVAAHRFPDSFKMINDYATSINIGMLFAIFLEMVPNERDKNNLKIIWAAAGLMYLAFSIFISCIKSNNIEANVQRPQSRELEVSPLARKGELTDEEFNSFLEEEGPDNSSPIEKKPTFKDRLGRTLVGPSILPHSIFAENPTRIDQVLLIPGDENKVINQEQSDEQRLIIEVEQEVEGPSGP